MKRFSVIVPVYNVEKYIHECVESVINQTFTDWELILVDDGSPDNCPEICDSYAKLDSRIKVIHKNNGGLSDARNCGLDNSQGEYAVFLDSDDYWNQNDALEKLNGEIISNNSDIVIFGCTDFNNDTKEIYVSRSNYNKEKITQGSKEEALHYLLSEKLLPGGSTVFTFKRSIVEENSIRFKTGIQDEDYDFVLGVFLNSQRYSAIDDPFYMYRKGRSDSITSVSSIKMIYGIDYTINKWIVECSRIDNEIIKADILNYLAYMYCTGFVLCGRMQKEIRHQALKIMKKNKFILKYSYWTRPKLIKYFCNALGFNLFSVLVTRYYDFLHRKREN